MSGIDGSFILYNNKNYIMSSNLGRFHFTKRSQVKWKVKIWQNDIYFFTIARIKAVNFFSYRVLFMPCNSKKTVVTWLISFICTISFVKGFLFCLFVCFLFYFFVLFCFSFVFCFVFCFVLFCFFFPSLSFFCLPLRYGTKNVNEMLCYIVLFTKHSK